MESPKHLEGIAQEVLDDLGLEPPMDAFVLAAALGLTLRGWSRSGGSITGDVIRYPVKARPVLQHFVVAHEVGHWLLTRADAERGEAAEPDDAACDELVSRDRDEEACDYLAGALLLPRAPFERDLTRTDWDLFALQELHPNVPASKIALRMCQLSPSASATVWDAGRLHSWTGAPDLALDRELVSLVLSEDRPARDGNVAAWPVLDGRWRRVVVVRRAA